MVALCGVKEKGSERGSRKHRVKRDSAQIKAGLL